MIYISHTKADKPLVEPIAQKKACLENSAYDNFTILGSQNNYCLNDSSCSNASNCIGQNICINGVICDNKRANNENICVNGAECENSGISCKVISFTADRGTNLGA